MTPDTVELVTPPGPEFAPVMRLVLGGIGDLVRLGVEELDDLQLAVERLVFEASNAEKDVRVAVDLEEHHLRLRVGPIGERRVAEALQGPEPPGGQLGLRRILATVVDAFGVEEVGPDGLVVRLEKIIRGEGHPTPAKGPA